MKAIFLGIEDGMGKLIDIRNMHELVHAATLIKQGHDRIKVGRHADNPIISGFARNKGIGKSSNGDVSCYWISDATAGYILIFAAIAFLCCSLMYQNGFSLGANNVSSYINRGDFKRAEMFVDSFLCGKFSVKDYYSPERAESLMERAPGLLSSFNGIPASRVVASGNDDSNNPVFKAICQRGAEAAIIYLTQAGNKFYVSGIEIDRTYAMNDTTTR